MPHIVFTVDNRIRAKRADLPDDVADALKRECTHKNLVHAKAKAMGFYPPKNEPAFIETWKETKGELSLPRGASNAVRTVLTFANATPWWIDNRTNGIASLSGQLPVHQVQLWDHQAQAVDAALEMENCLVRAPTGSGKTTAAIAMACRAQLPTLIVVWSSNLLDQWVDRLKQELGLHREHIGILRGSTQRIAPITVAMQQTLWSNKSVLKHACKTFGMVICDEVQRFAARTLLEVIDAFPARYRIGMSADETRKDRKEFLIHDTFGWVAADIERDELVSKRLVHDVAVQVIPTEFKAPWYVQQQEAEDENPDFNKLLNQMVNDKERNALIVRLAQTAHAQKHTTLMLTHRREHALHLRSEVAWSIGSRCGILMGGPEWTREFADSKLSIINGSLRLAAGTYRAIGQGLDVPLVDRGIACTPIATNRQFFGQVRGRLCRTAPGKSDAALIYLWDRHVFGIEHLRNLMRWNREVTVWDGAEWCQAKQYMEREACRKRS